MTAPAVSRLAGLVELPSVRIRVTVEASCTESRPLESISPFQLQPVVTLPAGGLDVSRFEAEACLVMIEFDFRPTRDGVTLLAASARHESIQLAAMRVIVAIYTQY